MGFQGRSREFQRDTGHSRHVSSGFKNIPQGARGVPKSFKWFQLRSRGFKTVSGAFLESFQGNSRLFPLSEVSGGFDWIQGLSGCVPDVSNAFQGVSCTFRVSGGFRRVLKPSNNSFESPLKHLNLSKPYC